MTSSDDVKLPFPLEVSQASNDKYEETNEKTNSASVDFCSPDDDFSAMVKQAKDSVSQGVIDLEKVIRRSREWPVIVRQGVSDLEKVIRRLYD